MSTKLYLTLCALVATSVAHATHYESRPAADTAPTQNITSDFNVIFLKLRMKPQESKKLLDALQKLIDQGADVNAFNGYGHTAITTAVRHGAPPEAIKILIDNGADILKPNSDGRLPIEIAESRIEHLQKELKQLEDQTTNPHYAHKKVLIDPLKKRIENLQTIAKMVNPGRLAPAAPLAPIPAELQQILTAGATEPSSSTSSNSAANTAKDKSI